MPNWFGRKNQSRPAPVSVPAKVVGLYGTAHTTAGDFDTEGPSSVTIDCELVTFEMPIRGEVTFTGYISEFTLHFGVQSTKVKVDPPVFVSPGNTVTIIMPVLIGGLERHDEPLPGWVRDA